MPVLTPGPINVSVPKTPAISFIVPAFDATSTLGATLRSVRAQTHPDWECVLVDDGSRDDPGAVVASMDDPRFRMVRRANGGLSAARNTGFAHSVAPVLCFLDADDLIEPEFTARMLARLETADTAACWFRYVGPELEDLNWTVRIGEHDLKPDRLAEMNPLAVGGAVVRRAIIERTLVRGKPFDESLPVVEDWDFWLRLDAAGARWAVEPEPLFLCRMRAGSLSRGIERIWRSGLRVVESRGVEAAARAGGADRASLVRRWHLRALARAVAADDAGLAETIGSPLGVLTESEKDQLPGALREAFCREHAVAPDDAGAQQGAWRLQIARVMPSRCGAGDIASRVDWTHDRWGRIARNAAAAVPAGGTLVVYGLGLNGRAVLATLRRLGTRIAVIDDHSAASAPEPRLSVGDLTAAHTVLVTPEDRGAILARLNGAGAGRILLPEQLLAS